MTPVLPLVLLASATGAVEGGEAFSCPVKPPAGVQPGERSAPSVDGGSFLFMNGKKLPYDGKITTVSSPIFDLTTGTRTAIGTLPDMVPDQAVDAVNAAAAAWDRGQGVWPQMPLAERIATIERFVEALRLRRDEIVEVLMWEIAKSAPDAAKEFDRTMDFVAAAIAELRRDPAVCSGFAQWEVVSGVGVRVRRGPIGVMLALAPFNYPLNEMYAMLIPALLMGNTAVLKLPAIGGLVHVLTAEAFAASLPAGVINFVSGSGRATMGPIMETGLVDVLGFIGGTKGADALIKAHPSPHRLKVFAQLEGKNLGIVLPDADLDVAVAQCVLGATSYNGQRCTAIKLIMVHDAIADAFVQKLVARVEALRAGLPWEEVWALPLACACVWRRRCSSPLAPTGSLPPRTHERALRCGLHASGPRLLRCVLCCLWPRAVRRGWRSHPFRRPTSLRSSKGCSPTRSARVPRSRAAATSRAHSSSPQVRARPPAERGRALLCLRALVRSRAPRPPLGACASELCPRAARPLSCGRDHPVDAPVSRGAIRARRACRALRRFGRGHECHQGLVEWAAGRHLHLRRRRRRATRRRPLDCRRAHQHQYAVWPLARCSALLRAALVGPGHHERDGGAACLQHRDGRRLLGEGRRGHQSGGGPRRAHGPLQS